MQALERLAADLWVARRPLRIAVGDVGARMTVIRSSDRTLMLHSPVELDVELQHSLGELGTVRWVLGPSKVHHLFLADYIGDGSVHPLKAWLFFEVLGVAAGAMFSGLLARRVTSGGSCADCGGGLVFCAWHVWFNWSRMYDTRNSDTMLGELSK